GVELGEELAHALLDLALVCPRVEVNPETLERLLDPQTHRGHRIGRTDELGEVFAAVAVLWRFLPTHDGGDRLAKAVHLRAGVVVVVLARDPVPRELEQARDGVAVRAVAGGRDRDRAG